MRAMMPAARCVPLVRVAVHRLSMVALCVALASCTGTARADDRLADAGAALFNGATPLSARLAGDADGLPGVATRCVNCHERTSPVVPGIGAGGGRAQASGARTYASALSRESLTTARVRHGGPATQYDAASFCALVRTGVDPAHVVIPPVMPRYDATDAQCESLWAFLGSR